MTFIKLKILKIITKNTKDQEVEAYQNLKSIKKLKIISKKKIKIKIINMNMVRKADILEADLILLKHLIKTKKKNTLNIKAMINQKIIIKKTTITILKIILMKETNTKIEIKD